MPKQYDFSDFEEPSSQGYDFSDFEDTGKPEVSKLESLGRGISQGLSFDTADELTGATEAGAKALVGQDSFKDLLQNYKKYRDESRADYKAAEEANPATYLTGDIGAGVATGLLTGGAGAVANLGKVGAKQGIKQLAIQGAKQGAAYGLGSSEADLLGGDIAGAAKDTAIGSGVGATIGAALPTVIKGAGKALGSLGEVIADKAPALTEKATQAFDLAERGINSVGKKAREAVGTDATDIANKLIADFRSQYKQGSEKVGTALKSREPDIDFSTSLKELEDTLKVSGMLPDDLAKVQKELNLYKEITETETVDSGLKKAIEKMETLIQKAKSAGSALGENVSFSPVENVDNKFLQSVKTSNLGSEVQGVNKVAQEGTGLSSAQEKMSQKIAKLQAEAKQLGETVSVTPPVFDQESNSLISIVKSTNKNGEEVAKTLTQAVPKDANINVPVMGDKLSANVAQVDIPEDEIIKETVENYKTLGLEDLNNIKKQIASTISNSNIDSKSKSILQRLKTEVDDLIVGSMDQPNQALYREGNKDIANVYDAGNVIKELSPESRFDKDLDIGLAKKLTSSSRASEVERALEYGSNLSDIDQQAVKDLPVRQQLQKDLAGESGFFGGLVNPKGLAIRAGEAAGTVSRKVKPIKDFTKTIVKADDTLLTNVAQRLQSSGDQNLAKFGSTIQKALQDTTKRDRLLWSLSQQPAFRDYVNKITEEQEN